MKVINLLPRILGSLVFLAAVVVAQEQKPPSGAEQEAAKKVQAAQGIPAKLKQSEEFMKKNAKSSLRPKLAEYIANEIGNVLDPAQRLSHIESYSKIFSADTEKDLVLAYQVDSLALLDKVEEAFKLAPKALEKAPENSLLITQLALRGSNAVRQGKAELTDATKQYGLKAIELIEANKRPANTDEKYWNEFKERWLPEVYLALGFIAFNAGDAAEAQARFQKAVQLNPLHPNGYLMLATLADGKYQRAAMDYNTASGAAKDAALKKAYSHLDEVIDNYARVVAITEPKAEFKQMHDQVLPVLQETYKIRKGSLDGLPELIKQYKK
jgi:tetratricopeptide (TPR) repeat protein